MGQDEKTIRDVRRAMAARDGKAAGQGKELLWRDCQGMVEGVAARYARQPAPQAVDLVHDAYIKFEELLHRFDPDRGVPFRAYLAGCVERLFRDRLRRRTAGPLNVPEILPDRADDVHTVLFRGEVAQRIESVLAELLPDDRRRDLKIQAFRLRHLHGWPIEKIRESLGLERSNTVSQWIHRVGQAFEKAFPERFPDYFRLESSGLMLDLEE